MFAKHTCPERRLTPQNVPEQIHVASPSPKQCKHGNVIPNFFIERFSKKKRRFSFPVQPQPAYLPQNLTRSELLHIACLTIPQFPNKRLIAVGKFDRNVKYHLFMSSKLLFHVPQCNGKDTFLRAFEK